MLSEMLLIVMSLVISSQSSSLWTSLAIVPTSICLIFMNISVNIFSGIIILLFIMVFIGGLLVLLVSVCSLNHSEQNVYIMKIWMLIALIMSIDLLLSQNISYSTTTHTFMMWSIESFSLTPLMILIISSGLIVLTKFILSFKSMVRSI